MSLSGNYSTPEITRISLSRTTSYVQPKKINELYVKMMLKENKITKRTTPEEAGIDETRMESYNAVPKRSLCEALWAEPLSLRGRP